MKIKVVSDLHLEFADIHIPNNGVDVLILSGDILISQTLHDHKPEDVIDTLAFMTNAKASRFRDFLQRCNDEFPHVIYVAGNHEFYHGKWHKGIAYLREEIARYPNITFLENDSHTIDDVTFVGGTLWTDMNKLDKDTMAQIPGYLNDFNLIRNDKKSYRRISSTDVVVRHQETLDYIRSIVQKPGRYVVVGHHCPSIQSIADQYRDDYILNGAYYSDLEDFILAHPYIELWTHGHTHHPFDYKIGDCRVVCNPRGYANYEDTGWDVNKIIDIG